jgi:uncharacterized membrane protein
VNRESSIEIDAPAVTVWDVFSDVTRWSEWTASVKSITALDGPQLALGARFAIEQPRLPKVVWEVTAVDPGHSWTWRSRSLGTTTCGWHEVTPLHDRRTLVRQGIDQRGPLAPVVGLLVARLTQRYLELEAKGLKAQSERVDPDDATHRGQTDL